MQKEKVKISEYVNAEIIGKDNDNKERKRAATEITDSDTDTRNSEDGVVGGSVRSGDTA